VSEEDAPREPAPEQPPEPAPDPPPEPGPQPIVTIPAVRPVVGAALDAVVGASRELRGASFYVGALTLGLIGPYVLLLWAFEVATTGRTQRELVDLLIQTVFAAWLALATILASLGFLLALIEGRNIASVLVGARLTGQTVSLREAVQRSRDIFWRTVVATFLVNVPLYVVQLFAIERIAPAFGTDTEITVVSAIIVVAILFAPLTYAIVGITLGEVSAWRSLGRSVRLFRTRPMLGLAVALIVAAAHFLILSGLGAGIQLVFSAADVVGIGSGSDALGLAVATAILGGLAFAFGTLLFTVASLTVAVQAAAFIALTHVAPALDRIRRARTPIVADPTWPYTPRRPRFRWLTRPLLVFVIGGMLALAAGVAALAG